MGSRLLRSTVAGILYGGAMIGVSIFLQLGFALIAGNLGEAAAHMIDAWPSLLAMFGFIAFAFAAWVLVASSQITRSK